MGKQVIDTNLTEVLVFKGDSLIDSINVRVALVMQTEFCWYFLYSNGELYATNAFGAKLSEEKTKELRKLAFNIHTDLISKEEKKS